MKDPNTGWIEPDVTINGQNLTFGQVMTLRVSLEQFRMQLQGGLAEELGAIGEGYTQAAWEISKLMSDPPKKGKS